MPSYRLASFFAVPCLSPRQYCKGRRHLLAGDVVGCPVVSTGAPPCLASLLLPRSPHPSRISTSWALSYGALILVGGGDDAHRGALIVLPPSMLVLSCPCVKAQRSAPQLRKCSPSVCCFFCIFLEVGQFSPRRIVRSAASSPSQFSASKKLDGLRSKRTPAVMFLIVLTWDKGTHYLSDLRRVPRARDKGN